MIIGIILVVISIIVFICSFYLYKHTTKVNTENKKINIQLEEKQQRLNYNIIELENEIITKEHILEKDEDQINIYKRELTDLQNNISKTVDNQQEMSRKAFENYCEVLDNKYKEEEEEYEQYRDALQTAYSNLQLQLMREADEAREELAKIEATRAAAIQAQIKEKEIEENSSFYCLQVADSELRDIAVLESIKSKLNQPRILSMLIWQTYWRTPMTNLCNNVIGKATKTGIYKITNQKTKECYIGQAVDLATRWKDHAKCGLGIDTPVGNKLYRSMQEFGIQNFSWEVLEECERKDLDEKEKYYINLYMSKEYGFNSTKGNN